MSGCLSGDPGRQSAATESGDRVGVYKERHWLPGRRQWDPGLQLRSAGPRDLLNSPGQSRGIQDGWS